MYTICSKEDYDNLEFTENTFREPCNKNNKWCYENKKNEPIYGFMYQNLPIFKCCKNNLLEILNYFISICYTYNIDYFITYGSLLGCLRNNKFIPWDSDIDVIIFEKDYELLCSLKEKINSDGFHLENDKFNSRIFYSLSNKCHIDITFMSFQNNKLLDYYGRFSTSDAYKKFIFDTNIILPLQKSNFENIEVFIPNKPIEYLEQIYGKKCIDYPLTKINYGKNLEYDTPNTLDWKSFIDNT